MMLDLGGFRADAKVMRAQACRGCILAIKSWVFQRIGSVRCLAITEVSLVWQACVIRYRSPLNLWACLWDDLRPVCFWL